MKISSWIIVCTSVFLALPLIAVAQSTDPTTAGATPLCANFDIWPDVFPWGNGYGNFDVCAIGVNPETSREQFAIFGLANESQCGPKMAVISQAGVDVAGRDALVDDNGTAFLGAAAIANYGNIGGFGWNVSVDGDPSTGQFICSEIFFNNDENIAFPNPVAAFTYLQTSVGPNEVNDHYLSQRWTRTATKVSNMTPGRNIPSAVSHTLDPYFPADEHSSRLGGNAILSNGNSLHYMVDRYNGAQGSVAYFADNSIVPGLTGGNQRCNVHTVTSADAATFVVSTTPTFVNSEMVTFDNGSTQQAAAGQGWFAMRASNNAGTLAFFKNDGSRITQIYGYQTIYEETAGLLPNEDDILTLDGSNAVTASNDTFFVIVKYQAHADGIYRPAVLRFQLDAGLTTVTPLPIIIADSDYTIPAVAPVEEEAIDIYATPTGAFVIAWRKDTGEETGPGAVVVRVYDADGTPVTGSFYPSSLADPMTDTATICGGLNNQTLKVGMNNNIVCVAWFTENGVSTVDAPDCSGTPKSGTPIALAISTAARLFSVNLASTGVGNWDLY